MVRITLCCIAMFILVQFFSISALASKPCLYQYQETRQLVNYVEQAAQKIAHDGRNAFSAFRKDGHYFYILDISGRFVLHTKYPEMEGRNNSNVKDIDGKAVFRHMLEVVNENERGSGWVHYRWHQHDQIFPVWMTAYVMKVKNPAGETYIIGSGLFSARLEKQFIEDSVDAAARLVATKGVSALKTLNHPSSRFVFKNVLPMIFKGDGTLVLDPSIPSVSGEDVHLKPRNLMDFRDAVGNYPFRDIITRLKTKDSVWIFYMWPKPGEIKPSKKTVYVRKVKVDGTPYFIGAGFFLARPVWMK